jgi:PBP1b-binding outer membrane lipoprotein LpoB
MGNTMNIRLFCLFALFLLLPGCATLQATDESVNFDPADKVTFYRDQWVQRNPPEVYVQPAESAAFAPKVLFIPFRVTQQIDSPDIIGYTAARVVWQTWLSMQIFPAMEFSPDNVPYRRDRALQLGRYRNADVVVGGFVTHVISGGTVGDSQLALQIEAIDTHSGQVVWSMAQAGLMPSSRTSDYFLFATKTRVPSNPLQAIAKVIAIDTGKLMQTWIAGATPKTRLQEIDTGIKETIYAPRDPVPAPRQQHDNPDSPYRQTRSAF